MHTYISNFAAMVLALGIGRILRFLGETITGETTSKHYALYWVGLGFTFTLFTQYWWSFYDEVDAPFHRFDYVLIALLPVLIYYLIAELFYPTHSRREDIDLKEHYWAKIGKIAYFAGSVQVILILMDVIYGYASVSWIMQVIRLVGGLIIIVLALSKNAIVHWIIYLVLGVLFTSFVVFNPIKANPGEQGGGGQPATRSESK
jgi:hypothetical protein